jgi:uncharacterized membrane protein
VRANWFRFCGACTIASLFQQDSPIYASRLCRHYTISKRYARALNSTHRCLVVFIIIVIIIIIIIVIIVTIIIIIIIININIIIVNITVASLSSPLLSVK